MRFLLRSDRTSSRLAEMSECCSLVPRLCSPTVRMQHLPGFGRHMNLGEFTSPCTQNTSGRLFHEFAEATSLDHRSTGLASRRSRSILQGHENTRRWRLALRWSCWNQGSLAPLLLRLHELQDVETP